MDHQPSTKEEVQHYKDIISALPSIDGCAPHPLYHHNGCYMPMFILLGHMLTRHLFRSRPDDVFLATLPKSGTTWLKALLFATLNRSSNPPHHPSHPLTTLNPHHCVHYLETLVYSDHDWVSSLDSQPSPRLLATHVPFRLLPHSIVEARSKVVYLCRNAKDTFVSLWHFARKVGGTDHMSRYTLETGLDHFCNGVSGMGPYWDHVVGYWNASLERPDQVLFVKYEDVVVDPMAELKRIARFVGCPFTADEERDGVAEGIVKLCGFESLCGFEVNKTGSLTHAFGTFENSVFFRRGGVGDWVNHLTPEMALRLDQITESKFAGTGLSFTELISS